MSSSPGSEPRRYGFSCSVCRRKKVRCDGGRPFCRNCSKSGVECIYKPESGDLRLLQQLQRANKRILELEEQAKKLASPEGKITISLTESETSPNPDLLSSDTSKETTPARHLQADEDDVRENAFAKLGVDENGEVQYFGATSRFHFAARHRIQMRREKVSDQTSNSVDGWLRSSSRLQKSWERLAFANLQSESDVDPQMSSNLLQIYWTWQHPLHNCVYRPCFTRDMALGGPYFSPFLLYTLYAHASRHASADDPRFRDIGRGERFLAKAKLLLLSEMEAVRPRIPTIQALLILGGRQCAVGKSSEGWLYTGMAIRMIKDIGLHLNMRRLSDVENLAPEDLEVRKRLFLSAYTWDKSISICLGRPPSLTEMPYAPDSLIDHSDDEEMWTPSFLSIQSSYPPTSSSNTLAFVNFCRLSQLINETYSVVYNERTRINVLSQRVIDLENRIRIFYRSLPDSLRIENISALPFCPPPHIFSLNILYHVTLILLYRPFLFISSSGSEINHHAFYTRAHKICVEETSKINEFLKAHYRTFNFKIQTYLVSYCVYTAATIDVYDIKSHDEAAAAAAAGRLAITLKMLESEARQTPGIRRSIDIIKAQLRTHPEPTRQHPRINENVSEAQRDPVTVVPKTSGQLQQSALNVPLLIQESSAQTFPQPYPTNLNQTRPLHFQEGQTRSAPSNFSPSLLINSMTQHSTSFPPADEASTNQPDFDLLGYQPIQDQYYSWIEPGIWNAGAGFVPSALNWSMQDMGEDAESDGDLFWASMR